MSTPFWENVNGAGLAQGDLIPGCLVPQLSEDFGRGGDGSDETIPVKESTLIVVTQSCDLENGKAELVALCPVYTLDEVEEADAWFKPRGRWDEIRKGRRESLHLLACPTDPSNNRGCLVVNFAEICSLPAPYLSKRASQLGPRWRILSPYLEHFSQAFGRYFMRVGLPKQIPNFGK